MLYSKIDRLANKQTTTVDRQLLVISAADAAQVDVNAQLLHCIVMMAVLEVLLMVGALQKQTECRSVQR